MLLETSLQRLATILADSEDAIISLALDGTILAWNGGARQIFGCVAGEAVGRPIALVFPPESGDKVTQLLKDVAQGKRVARHAVSCRQKDGSLLEISLAVSPFSDAAGKTIGASVIARDLSERRRMEREVLEISASERRRISYELHDGLVQYLAGVALQAQSVHDSLAAERSLHAGALLEIVRSLNDAMRITRQVARDLNPTEVEAIDLVDALKRLCSETSADFPVVCQFTCAQLQLSLAAQISLALYQIAQDAVRNALVHGGADRIELELTRDSNGVRLAIRDDGKGFDSSGNFSGVGLRLMQYRANTINATFNVSSQTGAGTVVLCSLPPLSVPPSGPSLGK